MYSTSIIPLALAAGLTTASPLVPRQEAPNACGLATGPFQLQATAQDGTVYPLAVNFAAAFGQTLRLVANPANPFTGSTFTDLHIPGDDATGYVLSTQHATQTDPNGGPVQFNSTVPTAGSVMSLAHPADGAPGMRKLCGDLLNNPVYYTVDGSVYDWTLCNGDTVDQVLGWKIINYKGTDPSCQSVALQMKP